jgi:hypothetical protein
LSVLSIGSLRGLFAPIVALVALFAAVSGVATAAKPVTGVGKWTGQDIVDESLTTADIQNGTVLPEDLAAPGGGGGNSDRIDSGLVPLSIGESATVVEAGPFAYVGECRGSAGSVQAEVKLVSQESAQSTMGSVSPGSPRSLGTAGWNSTQPDVASYTNGAHVISNESDAALFLDHLIVSRNLNGHDCLFRAIGTT